MAKKKTSKAEKYIKKEAKKQAKKHPLVAISIVAVVAIAIGVGGYLLYKNGLISFPKVSSDSNSSNDISSSKEVSSEYESNDSNSSAETDSNSGNSDFDQISFYFISAGTSSDSLYNGDSIYIKAGDNDILIDAGPKANAATRIKNVINQHCTDNKLEYVVATHAHADHLPAFYGTSDAKGVFESYDIGTIIDFPRTDSTTQTYSNYVSARDGAVKRGATHYTALECWNGTNGAQKTYDLGKGLTMNVLYQNYYENKASTENDYSVCLLFKQGDKKMLFTGDLEEDGIPSLWNKNDIGTVDLYKGGHHGSINANPDSLLSKIQPKTICTCCVAGSTEYTKNLDNTMPYQDTLNIWSKYTDDVYLTNWAASTAANTGGELNGTIAVKYDENGNKTITGSNNSLKLKDTDWMKNNRTMPTNWK